MRTTGSPVPAVSTLSDSARPSGTLNVSTVVELSASSRTANSHTGRCLHGNGGGRGGGRPPRGMGTPLRGGGGPSPSAASYFPAGAAPCWESPPPAARAPPPPTPPPAEQPGGAAAPGASTPTPS